MKSNQVIESVSHYIANALIPSLEPEDNAELKFENLPLSEEFLDKEYCTTTLLPFLTDNFPETKKEFLGGLCGLINKCIPVSAEQMKKTIRENRCNLPLPSAYDVKNLITFVLKKLEVNSKVAKVVVI